MASMQSDRSDSAGQTQEDTSPEATRYQPCETCPFGRNQMFHYRHQMGVTIEAVKESAERGHCKACMGILKFLSLRKLEPYHLRFNKSRNELILTLNFPTEEPGQKYEFFVKSNESAGDQDTTSSFCFNQFRIPRMCIPSSDTSSDAAFGTLKSWISRCQEEHTLCQRSAHSVLPRRILEIESIEPLRVRLVENGARREGLLYADYACLSHRWGPKTESNSLKGSNLDLYKTGVPEAKFGPLIRDAIIAIFRLGLRLVWIDCFCIIQDSIQDWELEAADMGRIYENALLTIAASPAQENCGMFSTLPAEFEAFQVMEIRGERIYIRRQLPHPLVRGYDLGQSRSPLLERGWVFQERLLSDRFIHFTGSEIFWECRESTWCECRLWNINWAERPVGSTRTICKEHWYSIVQQYHETHLSFEEDKLPALAGIARRYAELCGGWTYLSGLWKEDLPAALAWRKIWHGAEDPRPLVQVAPTWSWACLPRGDYLLTQPFRGHMPLVEHIISPPGADVYAGARSAEITVEGPTLDVQVYRKSPGKLIGKHQNDFFDIYPDFKPDPDDETKFRAVPNDSSCVLLLLYPDNEEELAHSGVHGIILMQQNSGVDANRKDVKFERIGSLLPKSRPVHVDKPFTDDHQAVYTEDWFVNRGKKRRITLV